MLIFTLALLFPACTSSALAASGWQVQNPGTTNRLWDIDAVDGNTAWAVGEFMTILKTTDGGASWTPQTSGIAPEQSLNAVSALNANTVWAVGTGGNIIRTTNGGSSWSLQLAGGAYTFTDVVAVDMDNVWAVGLDVVWGPGPSPDYPPVAIGYATIVRTNDGGTTWAKQFSEKDNFCFSISAANSNSAWVASAKGILKTTNAGASWVRQTGDNLNVTAIACTDTNTAWATAYPTPTTQYTYNVWPSVYRTTDGGTSWKEVLPFLYYNLFSSITAVNDKVAWVAGGGGKIYKTSDGGATWHLQSYHTTYQLYGITALDGNNVWTAGNQGVILRTTDGGGTGTPVPRIDSITPQQGSSGGEVSIKGWGFGATRGASYVLVSPSSISTINPVLDPQASDYSLWSDTEVRFKIPSMNPAAARVFVIAPISTPNWFDVLFSTSAGFNVTTGPTVTAINPASGVNNANYAVEVLGSGFQPGATARLVQGATVIDGVGVALTSSGRLTCYFDMNGKPLGKYDVVVHNPDSQEGKLVGGFSVTDACGQGGGASISLFTGLVGLLSLAGFGMKRKQGSRDT
jgi:photosystem II stability/assembly factor-like uncharacterized protein